MNPPDLELSIRAAKLMPRLGVVTVGELVRLTEMEILSGKCFGETSLREIKEKLAERGLRLGMTLSELRGRHGLNSKVVAKKNDSDTPPVVEEQTEHACCGHCEDSARTLRTRTETERKLMMSLAELELSVRATNCLESEGITIVQDLVIRTDEELLEVRNFTPDLLQEVKLRLADQGLGLGMSPQKG